MTESMVSAGHYNALKLERDELAAQVYQLRETIKAVLMLAEETDCFESHPAWDPMFELRLNVALEEHKTQSLLIHDAELMESEAKVWLRDGNATSMYSGRNVNHVLSVRARELREEAEGK